MIFDLRWPRMTLILGFMKSWCQELHFDIWFSDFAWILKFDPIWPQICNLTPNSKFCLEKILRFYWSFWAFFSRKLIESVIFIKQTSENRNIFRRYVNGRKSKISQSWLISWIGENVYLGLTTTCGLGSRGWSRAHLKVRFLKAQMTFSKYLLFRISWS